MIRISDHAFVRFLERSGAMNADELRGLMALAMERGRRAAERAGIASYSITVDGLKFVIRNDTLVTVLDADMVVRPGERG